MEKILATTQDLMRFQTTFENKVEINKALAYCQNYFKDKNVYTQIWDNNGKTAPILRISNTQEEELDVLIVGHLDVVPANKKQFIPKIQGDNLIGRGSGDMKAWLAVSFRSFEWVIENKIPVKIAFVISTDEEVSSNSVAQFVEKVPLNAKVVLDIDVADEINQIVTRGKLPAFIRLDAKGIKAHGSLPWEGQDANERLLETISRLRKYFPYYEQKSQPSKIWVDTFHVGLINGGEAVNVISPSAEAFLDFRLTEKTPIEKFYKILENALSEGVSYTAESLGTLINIDTSENIFKAYVDCAEKALKEKINFVSIGGGTDSRHFYKKGMPVIMHSGIAKGEHADNEYCSISSMKKLYEIQKDFFKNLSQNL